MINLDIWKRAIRNAALCNGVSYYEYGNKKVYNNGHKRSSYYPKGYKYEITGGLLEHEIERQHKIQNTYYGVTDK